MSMPSGWSSRHGRFDHVHGSEDPQDAAREIDAVVHKTVQGLVLLVNGDADQKTARRLVVVYQRDSSAGDGYAPIAGQADRIQRVGSEPTS